MTRTAFSVVPGVYDAGSVASDFTNIAPRLEPAGRVAALLDRMTGSYTPFQVARIAQTFFDLDREGDDGEPSILAKMDAFGMIGANEHDCLLNWAGGAPAINTGTPFVAKQGLVPTVSGNFVDLGFAPVKYQVGNACYWSYVTVDDPDVSTPLMGRTGAGADTTRLYPKMTGGVQMQWRINSRSAQGGSWEGPRIGLWCATEVAGSVTLSKDGVAASGPTSATTVEPAANLGINRNSTAFGRWGTAAWGYGAALTADQQVVLSNAISALIRAMTP